MITRILYFFIRVLKYFKKVIFSIYYKMTLGSFGKKSYIKGKVWFSGRENIYIGENCRIGPYSRIETFPNYSNVKTNPKLIIGDNCSIQHSVNIYCASRVELMEGCLIAGGCLITDENHGMDPEVDFYVDQPLITKPVILHRGVWLGEHVCVLPGSEIGEKSIIGSNSIVNGKIPAYVIAAGIPAKVIKRYNFETKTWDRV